MAKGHPQRHDLLDYVEGSLPADDRAEIKEHLASCSTCHELVADVEAGKQLLAASAALELSEERVDAIRAALDEPAPPRPKSRPSWRLAAVVAVTLAIAVGLAYVAVNSGGGTDDSETAGAAADTGAAEAGGNDSGGGSTQPAAPELSILRGVAGRPAAIVAALEDEGYEAEAQAGAVVVTVGNARLDGVLEVLDEIGPGETIVYQRRP